jgi:tripartite-type tricarboxylate transporter receptor subunit TctC
VALRAGRQHLLISFDTHAINPIAKSRLPYDTFKDFSGVTLALRFPLVIGANPSVPGKDLRGFLDAARRAPNQYSYASTGLGSMNHLVAEDLKRQAGVELLHALRRRGPAVQAVLGNVSSLTLLSYAALKGQIAAGRIKPSLSPAPTDFLICLMCRRWRSPDSRASRRTRGLACSHRPARRRPWRAS